MAEMTLQQLLQTGSAALFPPSSRYYGIPTALMDATDGRKIAFIRRRFLPQPERFSLMQDYVVTQGERLDNITARFLGDPEQFWRLCDANRAMQPVELEKMGVKLRITLPEGVPGLSNV